MQFYEMSTRLLGDTVGRVNDNLTSVVLAASAITLMLGYVSKLLLKQHCEKDEVSRTDLETQWMMMHFKCLCVIMRLFICRNILLTFPPASPSWVMLLHLVKVPLSFWKMHMKK